MTQIIRSKLIIKIKILTLIYLIAVDALATNALKVIARALISQRCAPIAIWWTAIIILIMMKRDKHRSASREKRINMHTERKMRTEKITKEK